MKTILLMGISAILLSAQTTAPQTSRPTHSDRGSATAIPEGAIRVEPYIYRYTDTQGRRWMYRQTPFGITKWEEKDAPKPAASDSLEPIVVTDLGDSVRFSHKYPFGEQVWTRKKAEFTDEDRAIMEQANNARRKAMEAGTVGEKGK